MKKIALFGSTGSIGKNVLEVVRAHRESFQIVCLAAYRNAEQLITQAREFRPHWAGLITGDTKGETARIIREMGIHFFHGEEELVRLAQESEADILVNSIVGSAGLLPTLAAIQSGKDIALANKETLVAAGSLVTALAEEKKVQLIPIDSEHSAIVQCLQGESYTRIRKIILTASGGPFRGYSREELKAVTVEDALKHPNWNMGAKITIDSATLMNKGLEVIEAYWLFHVQPSQIEVVIHPQSIIHSMVEMVDGSVKAQMGLPDMKFPIQYALSYPDRYPNDFPTINWSGLKLDFYPPDRDTFRCLDLAYAALAAGGTLPSVMNAANEAAVQLFLNRKIGFLQIPELIEKTMQAHTVHSNPTIEDILSEDKWARKYVISLADNLH